MRTTRHALPVIALAAAAMLLSTLSAFAAAPAQQDAPAAQAAPAEAETPAPVAEDRALARRHDCLRSTGSLITASRNRRAEREGKPQVCSPGFGRVYSNDDLRATGGSDVGTMLRMADPAIR